MLAFECSNPVFGRTTNPYSDAHVPGGSSGGEGALLGMSGSPLGIGVSQIQLLTPTIDLLALSSLISEVVYVYLHISRDATRSSRSLVDSRHKDAEAL